MTYRFSISNVNVSGHNSAKAESRPDTTLQELLETLFCLGCSFGTKPGMIRLEGDG